MDSIQLRDSFDGASLDVTHGSPQPGGGRSWTPIPTGSAVTRFVVIAGLVVVIGYPLAALLLTTVRSESGGFTLENYSVLQDRDLIQAILNSFWIASGATIGSLLLAVPLALLTARTDLPGRRYVRNAVILTFASPSFIAALGWVLLLGPRSGVINVWLMERFGLDDAPLDIFSPWGIIFVLVMFLYPLVYLALEAALENMDPQLEQAAAALGASPLRVFRTVTLPLTGPAVIGGMLLVFVISFVTFGPVAILGSPIGFDTVPTAILKLLGFPPRIETAAVVMVPVLVLIGLLLYVQRRFVGGRVFTTVGGKFGPRSFVKLGKWRYPALLFVAAVFALSLLLPFAMLMVMGLKRAVGLPLGPDNFTTDNFRLIFESPEFTQAVANSTTLALAAVACAAVLAFLGAWLLHRVPSRLDAVVAGGMYLPLAITGAAMGIALIIAYAGSPFRLSGQALLFLAYAGGALPFFFTYIHAGMAQIGREAEEASRSLGAGLLTTWRRVSVPLLGPALLAGALINFVLLFRELETSIFLFNGTNPTVATVLYQLSSEAAYQRMGAFSVAVLAVNTVIVLVAVRFQRRAE
jgi:iron(III) transport system permease protein